MVELQAAQARVHRFENVSARQADLVRAGAHADANLGGDDQLLPRQLEVLQGPAEQRLGIPVGIDVRGVDEIDSGVESQPDLSLDIRELQLADRLPAAAAAIGHGAEADLGYEQARSAQKSITHCRTPKDGND